MPHRTSITHLKGCDFNKIPRDQCIFIPQCLARKINALPCFARSSLLKHYSITLNRVSAPTRLNSLTLPMASLSQSHETDLTEAYLQEFLGWLIANGVEGIGAADSKIGLFNGENGERGIAAISPLRRGETFARVPLRLAITDDPDDEESNELVGADAPWSVRLACKILRMASNGNESPWAPYLRVLPTSVPNPLTTFSWEDTQAIAYEPARRQLDNTSWLVASSSDSLPETAAGPAAPSREIFEWAVSVVHSRTFGSAGRTGGVGVRMLVPLVDMLNHAGDEDQASIIGPAAVPQPVPMDNVRWDIISKIGGEYFMVLTTTRDIGAGEELLLSYGERSNDDFFLHYGFIPPRNVHDDVILFTNIEEVIDWHLEKYLPLGGLTPSQLQSVINAAYTAAAKEESAASDGKSAAAMEAALESMPEVEADRVRADRAAIKLLSRKRTDGRLIAALEILHAAAVAGGNTFISKNFEDHVREAVGARAVEVLRSMHRMSGMRLEEDLALLSKVESEFGGEDGFQGALAVYGPAIASSPWTELIYKPTPSSLDVEETESDLNGSAINSNTNTLESDRKISSLVDAGAGLEDGAGADAALLAALQRAAPSGFFNSVENGDSLKESLNMEESTGGLTASRLLALKYRAYKAMILWDALL